MMTILYSTLAVFGEEMYVVNASYQGGMDAYLAANVNVWYQTLGSTAPIAANLLGDALMVCTRVLYLNAVLTHSSRSIVAM